MSDKMRTTLLAKGIAAAATACVFALVQGCAMQPTQAQASTGYASSDSASSDAATPGQKPMERPHKGNPYFRTVSSTSEGSVTVEGNTIHYHAVAGLLIVHPKGWDDAAGKGGGDDSTRDRRQEH